MDHRRQHADKHTFSRTRITRSIHTHRPYHFYMIAPAVLLGLLTLHLVSAFNGVYVQHDYNIHALDITGPVKLIDGRNKTLTAHVFVKVCTGWCVGVCGCAGNHTYHHHTVAVAKRGAAFWIASACIFLRPRTAIPPALDSRSGMPRRCMHRHD